LTSCAVKQPQPDLCSIVNYNTAQCVPTDRAKEPYDKRLDDMLGYVCLSPQDFGDLKKYIKQILEELEKDKRWAGM
jgi:hypothetical protein